MPLTTVVVPVSQIVIPPYRIRQEPTVDIEPLANSILELGRLIRATHTVNSPTGREGLLHLPIVRPAVDGLEIVDGVRRFLAVSEILHWTDIEVSLLPAAADSMVYLRTQSDTNNMRVNFTVYERLLDAQQLLSIEQAMARERQMAGKPVSQSDKGRATERAGAAVGMSHATVEHGLAVLRAAEEEPEKYGDLALAFQSNAAIDPTYHEMIRRQQYGAAPLPEYEPPAPPHVNALLDRLDGMSTSIRKFIIDRLQLNVGPVAWVQEITVDNRDYTVHVHVEPKE